MKLWTKAAAAAAALALGMGAAQAQATAIDWTLSNGTFDDGGTFSGTFRFDVDTDTITDWNIETTGAGGDITYAPSCIFIFCTSATDNGSGPLFTTGFFFFGASFSLTNLPLSAPGTVQHLTGGESGFGGFPVPTQFSHTVTDGQAVGVLAAPEPAAWALMIGGFGLAGAALRAKRRLTAA